MSAQRKHQPVGGFTPVYTEGLRLVWDGEPTRPPKAGEWFMLPGEHTAVRADQDYQASYYICLDTSKTESHE